METCYDRFTEESKTHQDGVQIIVIEAFVVIMESFDVVLHFFNSAQTCLIGIMFLNGRVIHIFLGFQVIFEFLLGSIDQVGKFSHIELDSSSFFVEIFVDC